MLLTVKLFTKNWIDFGSDFMAEDFKVDISEYNDFFESLMKRGFSKRRILKYQSLLRQCKRKKYDLKKINEQEITDFFFDLQEAIERKKLSDETALDYFRLVKITTLFYNPGLEPIFKKFRVKIKPKIIQILTEEEVNAMLKQSHSFRNRTAVKLLFESGMRIGELRNIKRDDVIFDENGALIQINGKTGVRTIRVCSCVDNLREVFEMFDRPFHFSQEFFNRKLKEMAARAGIKKKVCPKIFRHTRATIYAKKLTEPESRIYFGWTKNSEMPSTYTHLSSRDVEKKIIEINKSLEVTQKIRSNEVIMLEMIKKISDDMIKLSDRLDNLTKGVNL
jgi:integrase